MEQSPAFVQHQPFQLHLLRLEFQLDKLLQNDGEEDAGAKMRSKNCGKIKIYSDEPVFTCSDKVLIRKSPIASNSPGKLIASGKPESRVRRNSKSDAASGSQVRLQDAYFGGLMDTATGKLVATKEGQEMWTWSQEEAVTERPIAHETATGKHCASSKPDCQGGPKAEIKEWPHNLHMSPATVHH